MRRHDPAWPWMIGAFAGALALSVAALAGCGIGADGLRLVLRVTARWSFLFFWLSYVGGALATLAGPIFAGLAGRARSLGLAFAAALAVHIGFVVWLGVVLGRVPLQGAVLGLFVVALLFTCVLALLSTGIARPALGRWWQPLLVVATTFILIAFGRDFVLGAFDAKAQHWLYATAYVPFALLSLVAIPLRLAAFARPWVIPQRPSVEPG